MALMVYCQNCGKHYMQPDIHHGNEPIHKCSKGFDPAIRLPEIPAKEKELRLALANLMDAIGNTWVLAQDCPPKIYKSLLEARRVFHSDNTI